MSKEQHIRTKASPVAYILLIVVLSALLGGEAYFGYRVHQLSQQQEQIKEDYSTFNNITFGLFSVDEWRERIAAVVNPKVTSFSITPQQKRQLYVKVEQQLHGLINKTIAQFNKPQKSLVGKLKKFAFNQIVKGDELHAQVPSFTQLIVSKLTSEQSQKTLKNIAKNKLQQLENQTYDSTQSAIDAVATAMFQKYKVSVAEEFNKLLSAKVAAIRAETFNDAYAMLACVLAALALFLLLRKQVNLHAPLLIVLLLVAFIGLLVGVTASIIEVDARLTTFEFMLAGQRMGFDNQVLFFQSKSILQIVQVLVEQNKPDAITAGVLIFVFVIIFPAVKLLASGLHLLAGRSIAESKVVRYFTFHASKWDMANVMVVGILMTYIGLNGILKSQLVNLNMKTIMMTSATANYTSLQPGYFIFAGYVVYEMVLFAMLRKRAAADDQS